MTRRQWVRWGLVFGALSASGCKNDGTQPAGPASDVVPRGGNGQNWYFNNPLPKPLTVTWTWNDGTAFHTLNFNVNDPTPRPPDTPQQQSGSVAFTFTTVGSYPFFCLLHQAQGMTGKLTVVH